MPSTDRLSILARSQAHLREAGLGYTEHFGVALGIGSSLLTAGAACLLHAFLPGIFTDKASSLVRRLHGEIERNRPASRRPALHFIEYEI
jgi:hypothetical protein